MSLIIQNIPTHLFLGFLGVGKTSAILSCFEQKPNNERWAVLVNEFGKQGIDGKIYDAKGISVKEVPGGCLCCVVGLPFQVAIMQIIKEQKPDRLFIESSGASHAQGVIKTLQQDNFKQVLDLKAKVCIIDPNHLTDKRYFNNRNYQAQLNAADVLVVNKIDQASDDALKQLDILLLSFKPAKSFVQKTNFGDIDLPCLNAAIIKSTHQTVKFFSAATAPIEFKTFDWDFKGHESFNLSKLTLWMQQTCFIRAKGIVNTEQGWHSFNAVNGAAQTDHLPKQQQGRIEIIINKSDPISFIELKNQLDDCIIKS